MTTEENYDKLGEFLGGMKVPTIQVLELLIFFVADIVAQANEYEFNQEMIDAACNDVKAAYSICCNHPVGTSDIIIH